MQIAKKISVFCAALILSACATEQPKKPVNTAAPAKTTEQAQPVAKTEAAPAKPVVQQYALDRLKQMSDTLTSSQTFSYHSKSAIDLQSETGQFVTFFNEAQAALQHPNKLHADVKGELANLELTFDGNTLSVFDGSKNTYAASSPLKNIDEMLEFLMTKAQISFPSADLMYSDPYAVMTKNLSDATFISETIVNGVTVEHFAYREPGIDWEIWLTKGDKPLPLRLAMTYKQVQNQPRFWVEFFDWRLNPKLKNKFDFKIPKDAKKVEFSDYFQHTK
jgi:hypothetical protein